MKIALIQDELVRKGGGEQVLLSFQATFPEAPIFTLSYNPKTTFPEFKKSNIITPWFGKIIKDDVNLKRFFFPLGVWSMRTLNLRGFDVVLLSTTHCAKYVKVDKHTIMITYCHTPFRLVWRPDSYEEIAKLGFLKSSLYRFASRILKKLDAESATRTDWFLTNSTDIVPRIQEAYHPKNKVTIIHPPVKCKNFYISSIEKDYFLVVSRFEPYKKVDLVIEAFNKMPDKKLIIVGKGSLEKKLFKMAGSNVTFKNNLDVEELAAVFAGCKALIFPQHEDYGITPLEANASGRPVIAYGVGGVNDTMVPYSVDAKESPTAIFFYEQSVDSLTKAVLEFEDIYFEPELIRRHAQKFDEPLFETKIREYVKSKFENKPLSVKHLSLDFSAEPERSFLINK
jgi:glycosyltransferase involved in cell wall biosynthesis